MGLNLYISHNLETSQLVISDNEDQGLLELSHNLSDDGKLYLSRNLESERIVVSETNISTSDLYIQGAADTEEEEIYRADTTMITADTTLLTADYSL